MVIQTRDGIICFQYDHAIFSWAAPISGKQDLGRLLAVQSQEGPSSNE